MSIPTIPPLNRSEMDKLPTDVRAAYMNLRSWDDPMKHAFDQVQKAQQDMDRVDECAAAACVA